MNASKENCREAIARLLALPKPVGTVATHAFVQSFLEAALRKLPSEASYERWRKRKEQQKSTPKT